MFDCFVLVRLGLLIHRRIVTAEHETKKDPSRNNAILLYSRSNLPDACFGAVTVFTGSLCLGTLERGFKNEGENCNEWIVEARQPG